ncbi:MAG: permease, partial [Acidobacteria bacterium]|nr:permease [Acidobacteriota bacterium]
SHAAVPSAALTVLPLLLLLTVVGGLVTYKATAALAVIEKVRATGTIKPRFDLVGAGSASAWLGVFGRTYSYFSAVWIALLFGVLIGGAVRAFVQPAWLASLFGRGRVRPQLVAGLAGAPLMLCSCCVAPVFTSVYERSSRLAPSLALMLAAPSLNPAALVLTFLLFGGKVGAARLLAGGAVVLFTGLLVEKLVAVRQPPPCPPAEERAAGGRSFVAAFVGSCLKVAAQTLPLILTGALVSMLIARWLPVSGLGAQTAGLVATALVALVAVPLAMPTFFELPLALILVGAGLPASAGVALLIAGPATNLPSLLTVGRATGWKTPALVAFVVWALAVAGGLLAGLV